MNINSSTVNNNNYNTARANKGKNTARLTALFNSGYSEIGAFSTSLQQRKAVVLKNLDTNGLTILRNESGESQFIVYNLSSSADKTKRKEVVDSLNEDEIDQVEAQVTKRISLGNVQYEQTTVGSLETRVRRGISYLWNGCQEEGD